MPIARLILLTALTMFAFAANSILNRLALADGLIGPGTFAAIRVTTGAAVLLALMTARSGGLPPLSRPNIAAIAGLTVYMLGFSYAYVALDAGLGALVLFGVVQITMFTGAVWEGSAPPLQRWAGMGVALMGLVLLTAPQSASAFSLEPLVLMGLAAIGWGAYSLIGRSARDPLSATGWNFAYSTPVVLAVAGLWQDTVPALPGGIVLAMLSGGVTSALGYALWYALLPTLGATRGALAQLSVPVIALALGALLLDESITIRVLLATALILGGIAIGIAKRQGS